MTAPNLSDEATASRLAQIDTRLDAVRAELLTFAEGDLDDTQIERFGALETELTELTDEREPIAHRAEVIARVRSAVRTGRGVEHIGDGPVVASRVQPFADLDAVASRSLSVEDVRSRALAAVEAVDEHLLDDAQRERAERLLRTGDRHGRIARHMLLTGSDAYSRAFEDLLAGVQPWQLDADAQRALQFADAHNRAMAEGSGGAGGFLVPFHLDPTIILTNAGSANPFRQVSRVETIATNKWHGVSSAGVTAGYLGEGAEAGDDSPSFDQPEVDLVKMAAYLQASFEVQQDTNIAASVGALLADAKDNFEAREFAIGDGAAGHVMGVETAVAAVAGSVVASATAATFAVGDVYELSDSVPNRWAKNASWVAHRKIMSKIRQFATGTGQNTGAFWATLGGGNPAELIGNPIREASALDSTIATGKHPLLTGDFKNYLIVDRIGMTVQYEPLVKGANGRPTGEIGWFAHWRAGANVLVADAFRLLAIG